MSHCTRNVIGLRQIQCTPGRPASYTMSSKSYDGDDEGGLLDTVEVSLAQLLVPLDDREDELPLGRCQVTQFDVRVEHLRQAHDDDACFKLMMMMLTSNLWWWWRLLQTYDGDACFKLMMMMLTSNLWWWCSLQTCDDDVHFRLMMMMLIWNSIRSLSVILSLLLSETIFFDWIKVSFRFFHLNVLHDHNCKRILFNPNWFELVWIYEKKLAAPPA